MRRWYPYRWIRVQGWAFLRRFLRLRATPHAIALGAAIGVFIAMTPTVGLQMVIAFVLATILGGNRLAAVLPAWITNPVTIVPIYTFNYWLGTVLVGGPGVEDFRQEFSGIAHAYEEGGFGDATGLVFDLGADVLLPLWIGSVLVGLVGALAAYPLMRRAVIRFHDHRARKRAARQTRVDTRLRDAARAEEAVSADAPASESGSAPGHAPGPAEERAPDAPASAAEQVSVPADRHR